jgi:hypothetical protein
MYDKPKLQLGTKVKINNKSRFRGMTGFIESINRVHEGELAEYPYTVILENGRTTDVMEHNLVEVDLSLFEKTLHEHSPHLPPQ